MDPFLCTLCVCVSVCLLVRSWFLPTGGGGEGGGLGLGLPLSHSVKQRDVLVISIWSNLSHGNV